MKTRPIDFNHIPVMPREVIELLKPERGGIFVDATLGGGGHSKLLLDALPPHSRLIGIDRDKNAIAAASARLTNSAFTAVHANFHNLPTILQELGISAVNGVLLDLGVSSHQLDTPLRGFSYRFDGPLDMRMDNSTKLTAATIVNTFPENKLADLIYNWGEERNSRRIARAICNAREFAPIETTLELTEIIEKVSPKQKRGMPHPAMRSFMAIRIAVNDELGPLGGVLENIVNCLATEGRIAVLSFHSLEDRIVKTSFQKIASPCQCPRDIPYCVCGKTSKLRIITKKPVLPSKDELNINSRAGSAKLRVAERI